ncbi:MAG: tRNA lysidine(34) synthetase TilS [Candidatus Omnitrophota bacterium]|jgi:tRNA(Ile)-lysidine synthase|nr:tRNA lysidine(34) synthetase TilS [Candidatus Omnitrophota bacterium]
MIEKVKNTIKKYNMLRRHDKLLIGISGGPDSVTLLYCLYELKKDFSLDITCAHLDHKFRGEESQEDRRFCEGLAKKLDIDIVCDEIDVPKIAKEEGISPEAAAREERYNFFKKAAQTKKITKIAVGHNKDDQAETVLMRAIRGSGLAGLGGMNPVKSMQGVTIIRPLIEVSRKDIEGFIVEKGLKFRRDSSNDKVVFTRNRVRHELIPYIEKNFNSNIKNVLANMCENLRVENEFLEKYSKRKFNSLSKVQTGEIIIDLKKLKKQPDAVKKRILRSALESFKGNLRTLTYQHWREMEELIANRPGNSIVDLPGGINIVKEKNKLVIRK